MATFLPQRVYVGYKQMQTTVPKGLEHLGAVYRRPGTNPLWLQWVSLTGSAVGKSTAER